MKNSKIIRFLASAQVIFYTLPWLMLILVCGTISQRYIGIYAAEKIFFSSFFFWVWFIPLPAMLSVLLLIFIGLSIKIFLKSPWHKKTAGIFIVHLGALLLLLGGIVTIVTTEEGSLMLAEGEANNAFTDYNKREFVIEKNGKIISRLNFDSLKEGEAISSAGIPFQIEPKKICRNCEPGKTKNIDGLRRGMAAKFELNAAKLKHEDEENVSGVEFAVRGVSAETDGIYFSFEPVPHPPEISFNENFYKFSVRKKPHALPFSVRLDNFEKQNYPGTNMAKEFESLVTITDGVLSWQARVRMNEPLRYRGYTLYQSAFSEVDDKSFSVFAVVKNSGRVFPYVSGVVMCVGLLLHIFIRRKKVNV